MMIHGLLIRLVTDVQLSTLATFALTTTRYGRERTVVEVSTQFQRPFLSTVYDRTKHQI